MVRALGLVAAVLVVAPVVADGPSHGELTAIDPGTGERVPVLANGRLYHLVLFATWCPPCVDELPFLSDLDARWGEDGYVLVIVVVPVRQGQDRLREFLAERRVPGRLVYDIRGDVRQALAVDEIPTHVLLDGSGEELARGAALTDGIADRVEREMRQLR